MGVKGLWIAYELIKLVANKKLMCPIQTNSYL